MFAWSGLVLVALAAVVLFVPRLPRRVSRVAGAAAVSPARLPAASGETAVPAGYVPAVERLPYDGSCLLGTGEEGDIS